MSDHAPRGVRLAFVLQIAGILIGGSAFAEHSFPALAVAVAVPWVCVVDLDIDRRHARRQKGGE
jgi:hypothetical protein